MDKTDDEDAPRAAKPAGSARATISIGALDVTTRARGATRAATAPYRAQSEPHPRAATANIADRKRRRVRPR
eukprot:18124-Pelagococcus_subviridis.AAC.1